MSSIVECSEVRDALMPMSVEFYHAAGELGWLDEDVELLEGYPVKKMSKSPLHEFLVSRLQRMIEKELPASCFVVKERPLTCENSEPEPDLMLVRGAEDDFRNAHPTTAELVVEVAVNTLGKDKLKAEIYARAGVKEYWLIDPVAATVTVYQTPTKSGYAKIDTFAGSTQFACSVVPGFELSPAALFA